MVAKAMERECCERVVEFLVREGELLRGHDGGTDRSVLLLSLFSTSLYELWINISVVYMDARRIRAHDHFGDGPGAAGVIVDYIAPENGGIKPRLYLMAASLTLPWSSTK